MLSLLGGKSRLCDRYTRRETLVAGGLSALGLSLPQLWHAREAQGSIVPASGTGAGRARSCIVLFFLGGPPQHSTWDPKPDAPAEVRGAFGPISTITPGLSVGELMPLSARQTDKVCVLRAVASGDNAHSSSGYFMHTGQPHIPMNFENANPGPPNDYPCLGAVVRRLRGDGGGLPGSITLPHYIFNTDGSVWPGQSAGMLGRTADPWLLRFNAGLDRLNIDEFALPADVPPPRLESRRSLLSQLNETLAAAEARGSVNQFDKHGQRAFDLLSSTRSRQAFDLALESDAVRERYGRTPFGNSVLLARRLVEAGVSLVQVNWYRGPDEPKDNPCWDSHTDETNRLKNVLMGPMDQAYSALLEDLAVRGLLDETLVVWTAEFGRTPKFNRVGGRDHWGFLYSIALAGGGVQGGQIIGASDALGAYPRSRRVSPQDVTATIYHALGYQTETLVEDMTGRTHPISRGEVISEIF